MESPDQPVLNNSFLLEPEPTTPVETAHRRIQTPLPAPATVDRLRAAASVFPQVNCYQPPIVWDRAEGYQIWDAAGNCWIDFTSTAVMTNTGHGHPSIRQAIADHAGATGLLAQFSFASDIRIELAERLQRLAPAACDKVYFWTVGSETIEAAFRLARTWGQTKHENKRHILTHQGDFHGWTYAAHQVSGGSAAKSWSPNGDSAIHHLPFPGSPNTIVDWRANFENALAQLAEQGVNPADIAAVFIESLQGWGALPLPRDYVKHLRAWADEHDILLIFDEIQTGFARTGYLFAYHYYDVEPDLVCIGKGVTSTLPLAAVLGPSRVLDVVAPAVITTTHAAHPLSCAAALANLDVIESEDLVAQTRQKGQQLSEDLMEMQAHFPHVIGAVCGLGLVQAVHVNDPRTGQPSRELARDWTWEAVKSGVMFFQVNRPTLKICPPLVIPPDALREGVEAMAHALTRVLEKA